MDDLVRIGLDTLAGSRSHAAREALRRLDYPPEHPMVIALLVGALDDPQVEAAERRAIALAAIRALAIVRSGLPGDRDSRSVWAARLRKALAAGEWSGLGLADYLPAARVTADELLAWAATDYDPGVVSVTEIAERLGTTPGTVHTWRHRHADFPAPIATLAIGPVWDWADVARWNERPRVRTGRPRKQTEG